MIHIPEKKKRGFLPENFEIKDWEQLKPFYQELLARELNSVQGLRSWLKDRSELEAMVSEDLGWRYIRMTCDTADEKFSERYQFFITQIEPKIAPFSDKLNRKILDSGYADELEDEEYRILIRSVKKEIEIFRADNIPLKTELQTLAQKYSGIVGAMTAFVENREITLQQAAVYLQSTDRGVREEVYCKIADRRLQDHAELDDLFSNMVGLRHQMARNADFENFRDYMFTALGRFDYGPQDCFDFHNSIHKEVVPLLEDLSLSRKEQLRLATLRPWDKAVDPTGKAALKPFKNPDDLIANTIACFSRLDPFLGECLKVMQQINHLDLGSRKGKAPGGYNYPLAEMGIPFIFMNATSTLRDMVTILHEGGHAVHSFLTRDLELVDFQNTPSEIAELASMSMELLTMDHWDLFFDNEDDLRRAKRQHLEQIIETLPWVATIDKFQHWIYENPDHDLMQLENSWQLITETFTDDVTSWEGLEKNKKYMWQRQLHLFEVPFYYIEYGFAQLGAIAVWKNYRQNEQKGLADYLNALKLGYTRSIGDVYQAANIQFNFSRNYIKELISFVQKELDSL